MTAVRQLSVKSSQRAPALPSLDARVSAKWCYLLAVGLLLAAVPALLADLSLARALVGGHLPGDLRRVLTWSEAFAHGLGVALIAVVAVVLDSARRSRWPRVLCMAYGAGLLANVVKLIIGRYRPRHFLTLDIESPAVGDTFAGFAAWLANGLDHTVQSFPSAHTATAFGFAVGLTRVYPRAGWLFLCLATLSAAQRLESGAHFLSDVAAGAAIGLLVAGAAIEPRFLGGWFDRLEAAPDS